jgi:hypothetical protein
MSYVNAANLISAGTAEELDRFRPHRRWAGSEVVF